MKKLLVLCALACLVACNENDPYSSYVNLGLSSGNLWKTVNEVNSHDFSPYFSREEMEEVYNGHQTFPSTGDWEELWEECEWTWTGAGYTIVGPNGKSMTLPALGIRGDDGTTIHKKDSVCFYWQRDIHNSASSRYFDNKRLYISSLLTGMPIRRIKRASNREY